MRNIHYFLLLACLLCGLGSCGDNENVSIKHILTQDEIDEIARQDSIREAQRHNINANLILEYSVAVTISQTSYSGSMLAIETDKIAALFGITADELLSGIAGEADAPEIVGFAINGSTHADVSGATNTNSPWGHWWDTNGDVTTWGASAMLFAEFDPETAQFHIGQYPARLTDGQTIKIIECLKYNDKRAAVVINVTAQPLGQITAQVVNTQELEISIAPKADYSQDALQFNLAGTLSNLGISSMEEVKFIAVNKDGSYAQEPATVNGFWYDKDGFVGVWGEEAAVYTTYGDAGNDFADDYIGIGQMPGNLEAGQNLTIQYGFLANNKIEMLKINIHVIEYEDPETPPSGSPVSITKDINLTKAWTDDYATVRADMKDLLKDAFKMTTYQVHKAIAGGNIKVYLNQTTTEAPVYTADAPGYWIKKDGSAGAWAEGLVWCSIGHKETDLYLYGGNHPDNAVAGDVIKTKMIILCDNNEGEVILNVTFTLTE